MSHMDIDNLPLIERGVILRGSYVKHRYGVWRLLVAGKVDAQAVVKWFSVRRGCWQYSVIAIAFIARLVVHREMEVLNIKKDEIKRIEL